ncbi:response regulator [Bradyrhizobium sp. 956_D2_N1_5]|jgi:PleD family two-component response regulator|uniref:response regulator transcription factor n=1 Tax=unclassified Bradyrhizobium TaxID=2631580 RepID=UPI003F226BFF
MVHSVAAQSGGRLTLKSVKGKGTTAEIWLPRDTSGQVSRPHGGMDRQAEVSPTAKALIVRVVDDDPLVLHKRRWLWKTLVTNRIESSSGQAALDMLEARPAVDIVVTDYLMPGMNGLQFAERVRAAAGPARS